MELKFKGDGAYALWPAQRTDLLIYDDADLIYTWFYLITFSLTAYYDAMNIPVGYLCDAADDWREMSVTKTRDCDVYTTNALTQWLSENVFLWNSGALSKWNS